MHKRRSLTRRDFNKASASVLLGAALPIGCSSGDAAPTYESLVEETWRHSSGPIRHGRDLMRELVRYATLAPNSHNTQPWKFRVYTDRIDVLPDFSRRCPAVDPDDHHLFATLGCATENLVLAAGAHGLRANVSVINATADAIRIDFEPAAPEDSPQYRAITKRQCTRANYDGKQVPSEQLSILEASAQNEDVAAIVFTGKRDLETILEYVVAGNTTQMNDTAFMSELKQWIRFSESSIVEHRDGLFSASSGNPTVPNWIGRTMLKFVFTEDGENEKYTGHVRGSAGVIAFVSQEDNRESWINVGRCYERFALQATAFGLRHAHINQAVEVPEIRAQFADYLGIGERRPDLLVRFGYGPELPRSLRRPIDQVIIA